MINQCTYTQKSRKGFIFTIDSIMALLFAFLILSIPVSVWSDDYRSLATEASVAALHKQTHTKPTELIRHLAGMCGEYILYNEKMDVIYNERTCICNNQSTYTYVYVDEDGTPFLAEIKVCRSMR
ncbi:MAG: hypothetical protein QXS93_04390 [Candidatus Micrarchaeia archaeon]